jgi:hypothetical protein
VHLALRSDRTCGSGVGRDNALVKQADKEAGNPAAARVLRLCSLLADILLSNQGAD